MESQAARRRITTISGHFGTGIVTEDVTAANPQLFPLNCNNYLSTPFRRHDSRILFGRQASAAQGYFMRQAISSVEQDKVQQPRVCSANCINEDNSAADKPPSFSRPATVKPLFSRPAEKTFNCYNAGVVESLPQDKMLSAPECPKFSRPRATAGAENQLGCRRQMLTSQMTGTEWSPRINVAESKSYHVITVELPGVDISNVRVEMDDKNIIVKGRRSMKWWKAPSCSNDSFATYHKREISQGPYQVVWPLPAGANKDAVYAEFVEGILHITIPKL